jgi:uncharacterized surface protein with fasciclin (FAS1) repeats
MNKKIERSGLILGIIVFVVLIVIGIWWYGQSSATSNDMSATVNKQTVAVDVYSTKSVNAIIESSPDLSTYASYFTSTGVSSLTSGNGPYTIFAPTNVAFSHQKTGSISGLGAAAQKRLVEYHIVTDRALDPKALYFGTVQAMSGDMLNFSDNQAGEPQVNSSFITHAYKGSNGVVYAISEVLLPPSK